MGGIREGFCEGNSDKNGDDENNDPKLAESGRSKGWGRRNLSWKCTENTHHGDIKIILEYVCPKYTVNYCCDK